MTTVFDQANIIEVLNNVVNVSIDNQPLQLSVSGQGTPGVGFPPGGLTGQTLIKRSNANFDTEWGNTPASLLSSNLTAGEDLSALRVVYNDPLTNKILYADKNNLDTIKSIAGVTTQSGIIDDLIQVVTSGTISDPFWNWDMMLNNSLYLGSNGAITQGDVAGLSVVRVGYAINPTTIYVRIGETIITT